MGQEVEHKHRTNTPSVSSYQPLPPSFHVVVWVVEPLLVLPKVREGIPFLFAGVLVFFPRCGCQEVGTQGHQDIGVLLLPSSLPCTRV